MPKLIWGNTFIKAFKRSLKKHPDLRPDIEKALRLLEEDPFSPQLATHKLKGKLSGSWACSVNFRLRIVFDLVEDDEGSKNAILLIEIGNHDAVY